MDHRHQRHIETSGRVHLYMKQVVCTAGGSELVKAAISRQVGG